VNRLIQIVALTITLSSFWLAARAVEDLPGRIDANGRLLRMRVEGKGSPAVVLEIGLGGPLEYWDLVQPEVARFTKVFAYDRIGAVDSDPKLTGEEIARELRAALQSAGIEPPYVLVGQSFGGIYNRIFASRYPNEVVGIVLLDPAQEDFLHWMESHYPDYSLSKADVKNWAEGEGVWDTLDELKAAGPLPRVPIIVVTGTKCVDDGIRARLLPVWTAAHAKWVNKQPKGRHVLAPKSGHGVEVEAPALVVMLIREVVDTARGEQVEGARQ
jgi:pimeloyl-ACP methyl ester carboxylesterase